MPRRWLEGRVTAFGPFHRTATDAVALTIVSAAERVRMSPRLIRACRTLVPQHNIYFKRDYAGRGQARKAKLRALRPG